jgi:tetratricopeptide (TPR) repeat protein
MYPVFERGGAMKSEFTEKKTIAWFTLAECVSRGERERAFGVYRLLSHSLDDRALALQLEADLLCAFKMESEALEKYEKAMKVYKQSSKLLEAAAVCEHMRLLDTHNSAYAQQALELYSSLQFEDRAADLLVELVTTYVKQSSYDAACAVATAIPALHNYGKQGFCYERVVAALALLKQVPIHVRSLYVQKAINAYMQHGAQESITQFLGNLSARDQEAYQIAVKFLKNLHT